MGCDREPLARRIERYSEDLALVRRYFDLPCSEPDRAGQRAFYESCRDELSAVPFDELDVDERIDWLLLRNQLEYELAALELSAAQEAEVAELVPFAAPIVALAQARRAVERVDPPTAAGSVAAMAKALRAHLEAQKVRREEDAEAIRPVLALRAAKLTDRLLEVLTGWHTFWGEYDPAFGWWLAEPFGKAKAGLEEYAKWLREEVVGLKPDLEPADEPLVGEPVGRARLEAELRRALIPYSPEELIALAERESAWCIEGLMRAAGEMGLGDDWRAAVEQVKRDHVAPGEQPYRIDRLADEAIAYVESRQLVTVPRLCRELWRMEMMTPERQKVTPFFTGGEVISVSFPTSGMQHELKQMSLRGNNLHFCRATVQHELIPGHHLQLYMAARYARHRRAFRTAFFVEGWTLHWEMLLWELGFGETPANRVGMLFWRLHRCARVVFSLRFHLGEMTAEECVQYLVDAVAHEPANARAEVRRAIGPDYEPLYQCAYLIGGMQVHALFHELLAEGWTPREVHDALLRQGSIPNELVRAALRRERLPADHTASWRWAGDVAIC